MVYRDFRKRNIKEMIYHIKYKIDNREEYLFQNDVEELKIKNIEVLNKYYIIEEPNYSKTRSSIHIEEDVYLEIPCRTYDFKNNRVLTKEFTCYYGKFDTATERIPGKVLTTEVDDLYYKENQSWVKGFTYRPFIKFNNKEIY